MTVLQSSERGQRRVLRICATLLLLLSVGASACMGLKPQPRYTSARPAASSGTIASRAAYPLTISSGGPARNPAPILEALSAFEGTPYLWGGADKRGIDCSGLVMRIFQSAYGITVPHSSRRQYRLGGKIPKEGLRMGDLVFFRNMEKRGVSHVGIYLTAGNFAHSVVSEGVTVSNLDENYYARRYVGARRIVR